MVFLRPLRGCYSRSNFLVVLPLSPTGFYCPQLLLFSLEAHRRVIEAYLAAMETRLDRGESLRVASVASFFLSRIDSKVDDLLDTIIESASSADEARVMLGA